MFADQEAAHWLLVTSLCHRRCFKTNRVAKGLEIQGSQVTKLHVKAAGQARAILDYNSEVFEDEKSSRGCTRVTGH